MDFKKYQHVERFGTTEVQGIEIGECYVFPKIDGTNASVWWDEGELHCGSRNRELSLDKDNAGFMSWASKQDRLVELLKNHMNLRLYGEWLVPHSLKTYREDAWRRFYVFDVMDGDKYIPFSEYEPMLKEYGLDYISPIAVIKNGSYEQFINQLAKNVFLIEDGKGAGEGIVIKNYNYVNKFGRTTWAKIVTSEFKEKHVKEMGATPITGPDMVEEKIADKYVTKTLIEKEYAKIAVDGWSSRMIPQLLNTVFYCLVKEEAWNFVKEFKNPKIDFKRLQLFTFNKVKEVKKELF